jgi:hypothetical protein
MNTKQLIVSVGLLAAASGALAQSAEYVQPNEKFVSTKTRAEVIAELKQAHAEGSFVTGGEAYTDQATVLAKRNRSRDDAVDTARSNKATSSSGS